MNKNLWQSSSCDYFSGSTENNNEHAIMFAHMWLLHQSGFVTPDESSLKPWLEDKPPWAGNRIPPQFMMATFDQAQFQIRAAKHQPEIRALQSCLPTV